MISQKSASVLKLTNCVYDIGRNIPFYFGDEESCLDLEFTSDNYLSVELGGYSPPAPPPTQQYFIARPRHLFAFFCVLFYLNRGNTMKIHNKLRRLLHKKTQSNTVRILPNPVRETNLFDVLYQAQTNNLASSSSMVASMWQYTKL